MPALQSISGLGEIADNYDGIFCDVWGVLHNGVRSWPGAVNALSQFRQHGGAVVLITNAPRPHPPVVEQLHGLGVTRTAYDRIVTSGDVTRSLIETMPRQVLHIGPDRDRALFEGMDIELVDLPSAGCVVCTGLRDDRRETPEDYRQTLQDIRARELPFICANPDIVVEYGGRLLWCAGALARDYRELGGQTHIVGKPYAPIYEAAHGHLQKVAGREIANDRILAIGDGLPTDILGASDYGIDALYISAGIHAGEYSSDETVDIAKLHDFLARNNANPVAWAHRLDW